MISKQEFQNRIEKVRTRMAESGLSALVLLDTGAHTRGGNVRYLTNFMASIVPQLNIAVITPKRVALCVQPGLQKCGIWLAQQSPVVEDVFGTAAGMWEYSGDKDIRSALDAAKITKGKVGIDGLAVAGEPAIKAIKAALSNFEIVENTGIVEQLRMVKSPAECESIRKAAHLADTGWKTFQKSIKAGGSVVAAISEGEHAAKLNGAEDAFMFMSPSDQQFVWGNSEGHGARGVQFKEGELVSGEMNARVDGYCAQVARAFFIGKASAEQKRYWEAGLAAYKKLASLLRPGAIASEIFLAGDEVIKKAGFKPVVHRNGHGMGLTIAETLNIFKDDNTEIKPGYYIAVHINAPLSEKAVILLGQGFLVNEKGREDLHTVEFTPEI